MLSLDRSEQRSVFSRWGRVLFSVVVAVVLITSISVYMQGKKSEAAPEAKAWDVRCMDKPPKEEGGKSEGEYCEMFSTLSVKETGQLFMGFAIGFPDEAKGARGVLQLPLGVLLTEDMLMQIDKAKPSKFSVRTCTEKGCFAFLTLSDDLLSQMKKGKQVVVAFKNADGKALAVPFPLSGFTKALKGVQP